MNEVLFALDLVDRDDGERMTIMAAVSPWMLLCERVDGTPIGLWVRGLASMGGRWRFAPRPS